MSFTLLNVGANAKTIKSNSAGLGYLTGILYLAPARESGINTCPRHSKGCAAACLFTAGMGKFSNVKKARIRKTKLFYNQRDKFRQQLYYDIINLRFKARKVGVSPAVRLNGTSDICWHKVMPEIFSDFPDVQFYDYTKVIERLWKPIPKNYHLTFSRSEKNDKACLEALEKGFNVALVYKRNEEIPKLWNGFTVYSGDEHDLRFLDPFGVIALKSKGKAKYDKTGFVL